MKLEHLLTPYTKETLKLMRDLNVRPETMKLKEENIEHSDINYSNILFFDWSHKAKEIKAKINK